MTNTRALVLMLATSATTGALVWSLASARAVPMAPPATSLTEEDLRDLKARVGAMEQAGGRALAQQLAATSPSAKPPEPEAPPLVARPKTPPTPEETRALAAQNFARYDAHFRGQPRDDSWATATERSVETVLHDPAFSFAHIDEFRCAATVCRLEAQVADEQQFEDFAHAFTPKTTFLPSGTFRQYDDGQGHLKVEAFLLKPGATLPHS